MKKFFVNQKGEAYAYSESADLVFFTSKTTEKKGLNVLRNNIPVKRMVKHLYACHRNDAIPHFLATVAALRGGDPVSKDRGKGLFYQFNFYKDRVVIHYNPD